MKRVYINLTDDGWEFSQIKFEHSFECDLKKRNNKISLTFHPLCSYLEKQLYTGCLQNWKKKEVRIFYDENIPVNKVAFAGFKSCAFE